MNLHIGGKERKSGWKLLNILPGPHVDFVGDISDLSQFADSSIRKIYASHVLEHVPQPKMHDTIAGIYRVLKKGGEFLVSVPDLDILCQFFISPRATGDQKFHAMRMMFGGQVDPHDYHYFGWNFVILDNFLHHAGFSSIKRVEHLQYFDDDSEYKPYGFPISLNAIAIK